MTMQVRRVGSFSLGTIAAALAALLAGSADAAPISVGEGAFSGTATSIDFSGRGFNELVTTQYASVGVTFSGGLYANVLAGDPAPSAQNYPFGAPTLTNTITIDFSSSMLRAGFDVRTPTTGDSLNVSVSAYSGDTLVSTGNLVFGTSAAWTFVGIEDAADGIDRLVLSATSPSTGSRAFAIDNFRFEAPAVIPEPSAALLFPAGLLIASSALRRRRLPRVS